MNDIWLQSWGPDGSFDTHIDIFIYDVRLVINVINDKNDIIDMYGIG